MELISLQFLIFLIALVALYYGVGACAPRWQWTVLLAGSLAFMALAGGVRAVAYMAGVALVTWGASLTLDHFERASKQARKEAKGREAKRAVRAAYTRRKRVVLILALALCLGVLFYCKYWNVTLYYLGGAQSFSSLGILLPLGLSFYMFQSLSYLIDSYNAKYPPQRNFARYLLFVSYFPQVIQGPINRYDSLGSQLFEPKRPEAQGMRRGLLRMGLGLLKKVAIANVLANVVTVVFEGAAGPLMPGTLAVWGVLVYSVQMYADFSGGIDLVEGTSELLGIQMAPNFRQPYFSTSLAEFWRRWHMSLGAWMRDYVFYPLAVTRASKRLGKWAGKRGGRHLGRTIPACVANVIVFLLVGLWHGAQMHYLLWGLYNGVVVALSDLLAPTFDRLTSRLHVRRESAWFHLLGIARTFAVVCVGRFFDCFVHVSDSFFALRNIFVPSTYLPVGEALAAHGAVYADVWGFPLPTLLACVVVLAIDVAYERGCDVRDALLGWRVLPRALALVALVALVAAAASLDTTAGGGGFLYANF